MWRIATSTVAGFITKHRKRDTSRLHGRRISLREGRVFKLILLMRGRALGFRNGCLFQNDVCVSLWGQQQELTDDEQAGKAASVEDLKALKKRHTTPVRKAQRGQI